MNHLKIFKRLKNGKPILSFFKKSNEISYTINISFKNDLFQLHFYNFDGMQQPYYLKHFFFLPKLKRKPPKNLVSQ